jgi:thioredoxin reductase (NADPH)
MEAQLCFNEEIVLVGGGNSAGQAAIYMVGTGRVSHVHMLVRSRSLSATMSSYLVERIQASPNITIHYDSEVIHVDGTEGLEQVQWQDRVHHQIVTRSVRSLFVMIGAEPNTHWLKGCLSLDPKGFIQTGKGADGRALESPYSTVHSGLFAIGDVRADSVKRVASAVGEGSVVIQWVHQCLNRLKEQDQKFRRSSPSSRKAS